MGTFLEKHFPTLTQPDNLANSSVLLDETMVVTDDESTAREWLGAARAGDAEAFGELCRQYEPRLIRQATGLCGNPTLGEELAQETLVEAWRCLKKYDGRCRFFTWVCAILLNRFRNFLRAKRAAPESASFIWGENDSRQLIDESKFHTPMPPDEAAQSSEAAAILWRCVQALPRKHQQVIYLRFFAGDSLEGIAGALGCSVGTIKSRLFHALEKLRRMKDLEASHER